MDRGVERVVIVGRADRQDALRAWAALMPGAGPALVKALEPGEGSWGLAAGEGPAGVAVSFEDDAPGWRAEAEAMGWRWVALPSPTRAGEPARTGVRVGRERSFDLASLIGRGARAIDEGAMARAVSGKRVLVTGAGGSIGSEIARLCAARGPSALTLVDRSENALFEIDRRMRERGDARSRAVLLDVVDAEAARRLIEEERPEVIFHAAAHKHVPLMEDHPSHAVENNYFGTKSVADAAVSAGVGRVVVISSDKAVNPTSVMGATKRLAERYAQGLNRRPGHGTRFSMVRFGNVLGSACSVLPIWSAQLAEGGPITVTDVRMTRYFMTITEAASLVVQSASITDGHAEAGEIFVLDMGEPVRIIDLAERFVRSHGLRPRRVTSPSDAAAPGTLGEDEVEIVITGARPGEKLFEELASSAERVRPTPLDGIGAWVGSDEPPDLDAMTADLARVRASRDREAVVRAIRRWTPEMRPAPSTPVGRGTALSGAPRAA